MSFLNRRFLMLALAVVLLAGACSDSDSETSAGEATVATEAMADFDSGDTGGGVSDDAVSESDAEAPESPPAIGQPVGNAALQPTDIGRDLIFTARIDVVVDDVALAGAEAQQAIGRVGGLLFGQETVSEPRARSVLTFKVPPADFAEALDRLGKIGTVRDQTVTTDDVTDRLVDLASQIQSMEISVERLRGFLADADSVQTVASLENELLNRETRLELLRGQERTIEGQVSLATITLVLEERVYAPSVRLTQTVYEGHDAGAGCPGGRDVGLDGPGSVTGCYLVENNGDRDLDDISVVDEGLDIRFDRMELVRGTERLAPGQSAIYALDLDAEESVNLAASVRATAVDHGQLSSRAEHLHIFVPVSDAPPGFGDSVGAGVDVLQAIVSVVVIVVGFVIPFLWVPVLAIAVIWWIRRRRSASGTAEVDTPEPAPEVPSAT
jgi:hypothetical protein